MSLANLARGGAIEPFGADRGDRFLQELHALDQPGQFLAGDFVGGRIACIDIGAIEPGKATLGEAAVTRPHVDELRRDPFGLGAQKFQLVGFRAIKRQDEQGAMIEAFSGLVQQKSRLVLKAVTYRARGEL